MLAKVTCKETAVCNICDRSHCVERLSAIAFPNQLYDVPPELPPKPPPPPPNGLVLVEVVPKPPLLLVEPKVPAARGEFAIIQFEVARDIPVFELLLLPNPPKVED
jgi:hypothetical protein